jgi:AcrR family transcriptional regulator
MPRPARFTPDQILAAARALVLQGGAAAATVPAIAKKLGAPSGSIYHRFPSRELLLGEAWLSSHEAYLAGLLAALSEPGRAEALRLAVGHTAAFVRAEPQAAALVLLHRLDELTGAPPPRPLAARLARLDEELQRALKAFAARRGRVGASAVERAALAVLDLPQAQARRRLRSGSTDSDQPALLRAARALLG